MKKQYEILGRKLSLNGNESFAAIRTMDIDGIPPEVSESLLLTSPINSLCNGGLTRIHEAHVTVTTNGQQISDGYISVTTQFTVSRGLCSLCKAANCKEVFKNNMPQQMIEEVSAKNNDIGTVAEFATLWQMIAVLVIVTAVTCFFFLWTAMLVRANLVAWPLAIRERRLKMIRDNEYELIHRYKRELLLSHLFQTPEDGIADDEQTNQNARQT